MKDVSSLETERNSVYVPSLRDMCERINSMIRYFQFPVKIDIVYPDIPKRTIEYTVQYLRPHGNDNLEIKVVENEHAFLLPLPLEFKFRL